MSLFFHKLELYNGPFSVWVVCESCIEPVPPCSHGDILVVDPNSTNSCCPQYYCGKHFWLVWLCVFVSSLFIQCFLPFFPQSVMLINALNHLWAVHLVSLWLKLLLPVTAVPSITVVNAWPHMHVICYLAGVFSCLRTCYACHVLINFHSL